MEDATKEKNIFARGRGEDRFRRTLAEREDALEAARAGRSDDECSSDLRCLLVELEAELHRAEHDNAGAFKFERLARETAALASLHSEGPHLEAVSEGGRREIRVPPELAGRRYVFLALNELDRINKEGKSTAAGDAGLKAAIEAALAAAAEVLGEDRAAECEIFRYGGNEYCLELPNATEMESYLIAERLRRKAAEIAEYPDIEAPPLSVAEVSLEDVAEVLSGAHAADRAEEGLSGLGRELVALLRRAADYGLEVAKYETRAERARSKMEAEERGEISAAEARAFFDSYLKKGFYGVAESWGELKALMRAPDFDSRVSKEAYKTASERIMADEELENFEWHLGSGRFMEMRALAKRRAEPGEHAPVHNPNPAKIPKITAGLAALESARRAHDKASAALESAPDDQRETRTLEFQVAALQLEIEAARRDGKTGLGRRGRFFEEWNRQAELAVGNGGHASVIFIDMGFLKYFNDAGGRPVGDAALTLAADIMEKSAHESSVRAEAYRYGGDEFAIRVEGGRKEAEKIREEILRLAASSGLVPDLDGLREQGVSGAGDGHSRADYAPTGLVFNFGIAELSDVWPMMNDLRANGELARILERKDMTEGEFAAELAVRLADAGVNFEKATSRMRYLMELIASPEYDLADSRYRRRVDAIIRYSQKAIFGETQALRFFAEGLKYEGFDKIEEQVERFVADRIEKAQKIFEGEKDLADKLVELYAIRTRLNRRIVELKEELGGEHERVRELMTRRKEAELALAAVVSARGAVKDAAIDKAA